MKDAKKIKNKMIEFNNKFSKYTSNYTLLVIFHIPNKEQNHNIFTYNDNINFLYYFLLLIILFLSIYSNSNVGSQLTIS